MKFKPYKSSKHIIKLPITILTPKIPGKTDSIFYAGKDIASITILETEYLLTTRGYYKFWVKEKMYTFDSGDKVPRIVSTLTDKTIKGICEDGNWGWFTIEINDPKSTRDNIDWGPTDEIYSDYDEAIKSFVEYIEAELIK